jgi:hypothetical protein
MIKCLLWPILKIKKELLRIKTEKLLDFLYSNIEETVENTKRFMKMSISEIISTEISLQKDVQKLLKNNI